MPNLHDWRYGLSILWAHLIAMSDENFSQADHVIDCFFQQRNSKPIQWATQRLEKYWHQIPKLCRNGDETDSGIYALIESQTSA
jgi:hypothetical protein